jgi:FMN phosphatase YigB (HAD superfamily)
MKKIISFDMDGTLVDGAYGNMVWLDGMPRRYAQRHGLPLAEAKRIVLEHYDSVGEGSIFWYDMAYWLRRFDLSFSIPDLLDEYVRYIRVLPNVAQVLQRLAEEYTLVIASNAARIFVEKEMSECGLADYFDHTISATSDFALVKKQEKFFRRLCDVMGATPEQIVHVGDHAVFDVEVPLRVGLTAFHYNPDGPSHANTIRDFKELLELLL